MLRKTLIAVFILLLVISGSIWLYLHPNQVKIKPSLSIQAIPVNATFIIETKSFNILKQKLDTNQNKLWQELNSIYFFNTLHRQINTIDSLLLKDVKLNKYIDSIGLLVSAHPSNANNYEFLFSIGLPQNIYIADINNLITQGKLNAEVKQRNYDENIISYLELANKTLYFSIQKNTLLLTFSGLLLEDAIRQSNINTSLIDNSTFKKLLDTRTEISDFNLYLNLNLLPGYLDHFTNKNVQSLVYSLKYFSDWIALDATINTEGLGFNGFSASGDSVNNFLNLFKTQEPQQIDIIKIVPDNTTLLLHFGISHFKAFYGDYKKYLENCHTFFEYHKNITTLQNEHEIDIEQQFLKLLEKEMALFLKPISTSDYTTGSYAAFRCSDINYAFDSFRILSDNIITKQKIKRDTVVYRSYSILHFPIRNFLNLVFGQSFNSLTENYFIKLDDYLVFANSVDALKLLINDYENGKTLENNPTYNTLSKNLSTESNIFIYNSILGSSYLGEQLLNSNYLTDFNNALSTIKNIDRCAIQFSSTRSFFYTNAYLQYSPAQNTSLTPVLDAELDTTISTTPVMVTNHATSEKEIFVQDNGNTIYLISKTGKILWKKNLPEKIVGKVHQIDALKNNKLQLLFNTTSAIYLIDRNGNPVDNFPITLKAPATNGLNVFDYDDNRTYRILLATEDKKIHNYDVSGKEVDQWSFEKTEAPVHCPLEHLSIAGKDYIVFVDSTGKIYAIDRRGEQRIDFKNKFSSTVKSYYVIKKNSLNDSKIIGCDGFGTIQSISLSDKTQEQHIKDIEGDFLFGYYPGTTDKDSQFIFAKETELSTYSGDSKLLYNSNFKERITTAPMVHLNNNNIKIGLTFPTTGELYLINPNGSICKGFPCYGTTPFCITAFTKQSETVLVCGLRNRIVVYSLPIE